MRKLSRRATTAVALAVIPLLLGATYPVSRRVEDLTAQVETGRDVLNVSSGKLVKKLSLGYEALLADIYWTRVVQYYGGKRRDKETQFPVLDNLLDITVTLDPQLLIAYKFGAIFLAEPPPKGAGRPDKAVELIRRGIAANPDDWRLWHDLGFIYYWDLRDYQKAAQAYLEGSKHPQAREWMKIMAAKIAQEGRTRDTSRFLWQQILESTQDPYIRKNAQEHLEALRAEEDADRLQSLVQEFQRRTGRLPASTREMAAAGLLPGIPVDPAGYPYRVGRDGRIYLDRSSPIASTIVQKEGAAPPLTVPPPRP